jgi:hypothetical protein
MTIINKLCTIHENKKGTSALFKVRMNFKDEVSPNNVEKVKERLSYNKEDPIDYFYYSKKSNIATYLIDNGWKQSYERVNLNWGSIYDRFNKDGVQMKLNVSKRKLRLEIIAKSKRKIKNEEIINVDELNNFILTGEYDYKNPWPNASFGEYKEE